MAKKAAQEVKHQPTFGRRVRPLNPNDALWTYRQRVDRQQLVRIPSRSLRAQYRVLCRHFRLSMKCIFRNRNNVSGRQRAWKSMATRLLKQIVFFGLPEQHQKMVTAFFLAGPQKNIAYWRRKLTPIIYIRDGGSSLLSKPGVDPGRVSNLNRLTSRKSRIDA